MPKDVTLTLSKCLPPQHSGQQHLRLFERKILELSIQLLHDRSNTKVSFIMSLPKTRARSVIRTASATIRSSLIRESRKIYVMKLDQRTFANVQMTDLTPDFDHPGHRRIYLLSKQIFGSLISRNSSRFSLASRIPSTCIREAHA